jgi:hypothetical protein
LTKVSNAIDKGPIIAKLREKVAAGSTQAAKLLRKMGVEPVPAATPQPTKKGKKKGGPSTDQ